MPIPHGFSFKNCLRNNECVITLMKLYVIVTCHEFIIACQLSWKTVQPKLGTAMTGKFLSRTIRSLHNNLPYLQNWLEWFKLGLSLVIYLPHAPSVEHLSGYYCKVNQTWFSLCILSVDRASGWGIIKGDADSRDCRLWRWKEIKGVAVHGKDERHQIIIIDICNMLCNLYNIISSPHSWVSITTIMHLQAWG